MKKTILAMAVITLTSLTSHAGWECGASSRVGWGVGISGSKRVAANIALNECAMRSGRFSCYIDYCDFFYGNEDEKMPIEEVIGEGGLLEDGQY